MRGLTCTHVAAFQPFEIAIGAWVGFVRDPVLLVRHSLA
jgi:hypothetical protein